MASSPPKITSYYYVLSQTWSRALKYHDTYKASKLKHVNFWILHGLWLGTKSTSERLVGADYSSSPDYEKPKDETCLENLQRVCPSLFTYQSNDKRHKTMYDKHGKCVIYYNKQDHKLDEKYKILTPEAYLCQAANLAIKYNMGQYLRRFHIGEKEHKVHDIANQIRDRIHTDDKTLHKPCVTVHSLETQRPGEAHRTFHMDQIYLYFDSKFNIIRDKNAIVVPNVPKHVKIVYEKCIHQLPEGEKCTAEQCKILAARHPLPEKIEE